jgi:GT2 family glycosyltransferase
VISAIVINYDGREYVEACLDALATQDPAPDEVLLVDNHSGDGSRELVAERYPDVQVVDTGANVGPAEARNRGLEIAQHELCLLVDNDVVLEPGCLAAMHAVIDADPRVAAVQARSLCADSPDVVHYDRAELGYLGTLVLHNFFRPLAESTDPDGPVGAAIALCVLTRRSVLRAVGGYRRELFILYEDNELSWKLRMHGHLIRLAPDAHCLHRGGTAGLSVRSADAPYTAQRTFLHCRNRWLVIASCMRWRTLLLTLPAQLVYAVAYLAFALSRGSFLAGVRGHLVACLMLPKAIGWRRLQRGRVVPDRELLVADAMTLHPGVADHGLKARVRRALDRSFELYWRLVRGWCG